MKLSNNGGGKWGSVVTDSITGVWVQSDGQIASDVGADAPDAPVRFYVATSHSHYDYAGQVSFTIESLERPT